MCNAVCLNGSCWGRCVGCEAVYVASEFPPSTADAVPLPPKGTAHFEAPALQSLGLVARLGGSLYLRASLPSLSLWDISPPRERLFFICTLCLCLLLPRGTAFSWAPALQLLGWWGLLFLPYICSHTKKSHLERGGIFDIGFQYLHTVIHFS